MVHENQYQVIIVGGGLAGLTSALHLSQQGIRVLLIEKHEYPRHKVCGEYVSNEVLPYLNSLGIDPYDHGAIPISQFEISTKKGDVAKAELPLGGFGLSRYAFDLVMYHKVIDAIDTVFDQVEEIRFEDDAFIVHTKSKKSYKAPFVIGAYGKRSNLDVFLKRDFIENQSPWLAVKGHYDYDFPEDVVALHNFDGGYCGLSKIETSAVNACYLVKYSTFKQYSGIDEFQHEVMSQNPHLADFFKNATPVFDKLLTIAQVSFQSKDPIDNHILMVGDSAGLIHPLCGNGMAMAIHSAKIVSELLIEALGTSKWDRAQLEKKYEQQWKRTFQSRLLYGNRLQRLLLSNSISNLGIEVVKSFPSIIPRLIRKTHGTAF